mgnify:CR=1 FL=1
MAQVILENVYKSFAATPVEGASDDEKLGKLVLRQINLTVKDGEFMVLVGPSGCGKSTLLRVIAGLEALTAGKVWVGERLVNDLPPKARDMAMVFQNYALYPHLTVYDNLAFGLRRWQNAKLGKLLPWKIWAEDLGGAITRQLPPAFRYLSEREKAVGERVQTVAKLLQIESFLDRMPKQLSGGQKQRVALGRAMARNPQVFLMDEPLSNLDAKLRGETRSQIVQLQQELGITTIYVTHDQTEAMTMGSRIAVIYQGQIQQVASPLEIYHHPANRFVAGFIGSPPMNFLSVTYEAPLLLKHPQFRMTLPPKWESVLKSYHGRGLILGIRPEHLRRADVSLQYLPVKVRQIEALGSETYLGVTVVDAPEERLQVRVPGEDVVRVGEHLWLSFERVHLFDSQTGTAIEPQSN